MVKDGRLDVDEALAVPALHGLPRRVLWQRRADGVVGGGDGDADHADGFRSLASTRTGDNGFRTVAASLTNHAAAESVMLRRTETRLLPASCDPGRHPRRILGRGSSVRSHQIASAGRASLSRADASLRLPLSRHPLRLGDLFGRHLGGHLIAILDRHLAKVGVCCGRRSQVEPHVGQRIVLRHAEAAVLVRHAEVELCVVKSCSRKAACFSVHPRRHMALSSS